MTHVPFPFVASASGKASDTQIHATVRQPYRMLYVKVLVSSFICSGVIRYYGNSLKLVHAEKQMSMGCEIPVCRNFLEA